jgi:hypothetical protein
MTHEHEGFEARRRADPTLDAMVHVHRQSHEGALVDIKEGQIGKVEISKTL